MNKLGLPGRPVHQAQSALAVYARLSVNENGENDESLDAQCNILIGYAREKGWGEAALYIDNNISGTSLDRPGLHRLVNDIKSGIIKTILVKDLSRLGRNNGETLLFLDFLQEKNVRLISIGDNYDTDGDDDGIVGIKTWFNENYARDISRKVRSSIRVKQKSGEFLIRPHFGFLKENNKLIVDERYRKIIQEIFELYIKGMGYRALAGYVQNLGVPTPSLDKAYINGKKSGRWNEQHIRRIITSPVYCGDAVVHVSEKVSFKSKKIKWLPQSQWIIKENAHEAIVSRETFQLAQNVRLKRWHEGQGRKKNIREVHHLFTGFIVCASCGACHIFRKKKHRPARYICGRYNLMGVKGCSNHHVLEEKLIALIVEDLQRLSQGINYQDKLWEKCRETFQRSKGIKERILKAEAGIIEKKRQQRTAYLDRVKGIIAEQLFLDINNELEKDIVFLTAQLEIFKVEAKRLEKIEEDPVKNGSISLEIEAKDIDRLFLEKYLKKIIVVEDGDEIEDSIKQKFNLPLYFSGRELQKNLGGKSKLIILYNLSP